MHRPLTTAAELETLIASPGPAWLFKHSNSCAISHEAFGEFNAFLARHAQAEARVVVVQEQRPLSNLIATRLKLVHQSPQLFLLAGGAVRWSASHWSITAKAMEEALARLPSASA